MSVEGRILRNQLSEALRPTHPALSHAVKRCAPSTYVDDENNVLVLRFGPGARFDQRIAQASKVLLADALVELTDPDLPPLGVRCEQNDLPAL